MATNHVNPTVAEAAASTSAGPPTIAAAAGGGGGGGGAAAAAANDDDDVRLPTPATPCKKKILFVVSHPNVCKSFSHVLVAAAREALEAEGHAVVVSDLVADNFNPVGGPHDFTIPPSDPNFFDYQMEQKHAALHNGTSSTSSSSSGDGGGGSGFAPDVQREMDRLDWCDTVVHQFPIYWWSLPAIHKGWFDRVLAYYWCYGGGNQRLRGKEWMLALTTGGPTAMQLSGGWPVVGTNNIPSHLQPFWVATPGMLRCVTLPLFIAGGPGKFSAEERGSMVQEYVAHIRCHVARSLRPDEVPAPVLTASIRHSATTSLCIVGATGGLGSELSRQALAAGIAVSGVIRSAEKAEKVFTDEERARLTLHVGSLDDAEFLGRAFKGVDAVVEVISNSQRPDGVRKILEAAAAAKVTTAAVTGGAVTLFTTEPSVAGKEEEEEEEEEEKNNKKKRRGLLNRPGDPDWMPWATKLHVGVRELAQSFVGKEGIKHTFQVAPPFMEAGGPTYRYKPLADVIVEGKSPEKVSYGDTAALFLELLRSPAVWDGHQVGLVAASE